MNMNTQLTHMSALGLGPYFHKKCGLDGDCPEEVLFSYRKNINDCFNGATVREIRTFNELTWK